MARLRAHPAAREAGRRPPLAADFAAGRRADYSAYAGAAYASSLARPARSGAATGRPPLQLGGDNGLPPRRTAARSLQLPGAVPVLDRRGPRLRHLRHDRRVALRQGHGQRRRRRRPDDRDARARARQHPRRATGARPSTSTRASRLRRKQAILGVYTGQLGGPVAELAKLVGEVVSVEKVPIQFDVHGGHGTHQDRRRRLRRARAVQERDAAPRRRWRTRCSRPCRARRCSSARRPSYRAKNAKLGIDLEL